MLIFLNREEELDHRSDSQALPGGVRPVAFVRRDDGSIVVHLYEWFMFRRAEEAEQEITSYLENDPDFQMFQRDCPDGGTSFLFG